MSLLICPECQKEVSEFSEKCLNCGCPIDIIKREQKERLYTIINGTKKDVTYFVNKILDESYKKNVETIGNFNTKLMNELDIPMIDFIKAVRECNGAPEILNAKSITEWKAKRQHVQTSQPCCPHCHSTNIKPISGTERAVSVIGLGVMSKKIGKSYKCLNCKYTW